MRRYNPVERNVVRALDAAQRGHHDKAVRTGLAHSQHIVRIPGHDNALATLSASIRPTTIAFARHQGVLKGHDLVLPRAVADATALAGRPMRDILDHPLLDGAVATGGRARGDTTVVSFTAAGRTRTWTLAEIDAGMEAERRKAA